MFGLVVLASSPQLYGKVSRLILKKTNRLTQAVVFSRRHFLCGALWNCASAEREGLSTHVQRECPASLRIFPSLPGSRLCIRFFIARCKFCTLTSTPLYSSRLYAQNLVFKIAHQEGVKVYDTCSCEKQFMIDGCICAARVTAWNVKYLIYTKKVVPRTLKRSRYVQIFL